MVDLGTKCHSEASDFPYGNGTRHRLDGAGQLRRQVTQPLLPLRRRRPDLVLTIGNDGWLPADVVATVRAGDDVAAVYSISGTTYRETLDGFTQR